VHGFEVTYGSFDPASEGLREALTSTENGYFCTRGSAEWEDMGSVRHPGTYVHGWYNRETTITGGRPVLNEDAAPELRVGPERSFVVEDAVSGVRAAKAGGMAALGVARGDQDLLADANVELVVSSLDEVDVARLAAHQLARRSPGEAFAAPEQSRRIEGRSGWT